MDSNDLLVFNAYFSVPSLKLYITDARSDSLDVPILFNIITMSFFQIINIQLKVHGDAITRYQNNLDK